MRDENPVFLYKGPHPVHAKIMEALGADFVGASQGTIDRLRGAFRHDFGDRVLFIEGGVPLLESAIVRRLGRCGPIIELAADTTHQDLAYGLEFRGPLQRWVHRVAERSVSGTVAVSDDIATLVKARYRGRAVEVAYPFVLEDRYQALTSLDIDVDRESVICVGKYREKNGQDRLVRVANELRDIEFHFVGSDTADIHGPSNVHTHGYVDDDELVNMIDDAAALVFPARAGAFPVNVLEGMCGGLPVFASSHVGNAQLIRSVSSKFIVDGDPELVQALTWYFELDPRDRAAYADRFRRIGANFAEDERLQDFVDVTSALMVEVMDHA